MKTSYILNIVVIVVFCCTGIAFSGNWKNESVKELRDKQQYHQRDRDKKERSAHRGYRDDEKRLDTRSHRGFNKHHDYHKHSGYRERPYGKKRHYGYYHHKGHRYDYQGHWKSWKQWDRYAKNHPEIHKHGHYYRENAHLMFRFRDPVTGAFFFFSIGR